MSIDLPFDLIRVELDGTSSTGVMGGNTAYTNTHTYIYIHYERVK